MRYSGIGGQAVMEGVMMKNQDKYAVAVRKPDKEIEVKVLSIPLKNIQVADGEISLKLLSNQANLNAREYKRVSIYVNGNYQRTIGVPIELKVYENIMVAKDTIFKDNALTEKNVEFKRYNIALLTQRPITPKDISQEMLATKIYRPGEVIDKRFSKIKPDIARLANVTVIFKTANDLSISIDGVALCEGNIGSVISVENKTYKKVYMGKVIGTNKILVEI